MTFISSILSISFSTSASFSDLSSLFTDRDELVALGLDCYLYFNSPKLFI